MPATQVRLKPSHPLRTILWSALLCSFVLSARAAQRDILTPTNTVVRVMAANITGNAQEYEAFAIRIFQGLKPDIIAIQEFNYGTDSAADIRSFVNTAFGTNFSYYRESGAGYNIPNGVISRFPISISGTWDDPEMPDRGFAWARIDLPGTNDLYVVSVHFKASSSDAARRSVEATALKSLIQSNFPANAWIVVAGDMNLQSRSEAALTTLKTFLSDSPIPADQAGDPDTNNGRNNPYDLVLPSFTFATNFVPVVIGAQSHANGLVFDSRVYSPLSAVSPVQLADSGLAQHMAVLKDFRINYIVTNRVEVPRPVLVQTRTNSIRWNTTPGISYTVERSVDFSNWLVATQVTASSTNLVFSNLLTTNAFRFYRVSY